MKKFLATAVLLGMIASTVNLAAQTKEKREYKYKPKKMMMRDGMGGMCMMHHRMMQSMMKKKISILPDGGLIIVVGHMIYKYDKDLNLVKETEIPIKEMMKKMKESMKVCPGCTNEDKSKEKEKDKHKHPDKEMKE